MTDLVEQPHPDLRRRQEVRVRLDAQADSGGLRLVGEHSRVRLELLDLLGRLGVPGERVEHEGVERLGGGEDVPEAPHPLVEMERRVAAQRHAALPEPVEQPPCLVDLRRPEPVGIEVLEKSLDGTDLDVLEPRLGQAVQRLLERVRLEADGRPGLDPAHVALPSSGSSRPQTSRWNSTNPSG